MEVVGKVKVVTPEQKISDSYTKRELVIVTDEQYPQSIIIEFPQGKCNNDLDKLAIGQEVKVYINLGGREWVNPQGETKFFNSIKGWKVESLGSAPVAQPAPKMGAMLPGEDNDDLPFG
jgi:Domain of unknown function (DUF3127)